jgi:hypothetical protein
VVVTSAAFGISSASILERGSYNKAPVYVQPSYDRRGAYIGVNVGYGWGRSADTSSLSAGSAPVLFGDINGSNINGVVGGGLIGYNQLALALVFRGRVPRQQPVKQSFVHCPTGVCTPGNAVPMTISQSLAGSERFVAGRVFWFLQLFWCTPRAASLIGKSIQNRRLLPQLERTTLTLLGLSAAASKA